jgi:hypothetical protein
MRFDPFDANRQLPQSLRHLARLGLRSADAAGYAIDQLTAGGEAWMRKWAEGVPVPETEGSGLLVLCFPLGLESAETGALSFVFCCETISDETRTLLTQFAAAAEAIWRHWSSPSVYAHSVTRIAELEAKLADSKISDRACGLLESEGPASDAIDLLSQYIDNALRPNQLGKVLDDWVREAEYDLAGYQLVRKAKALLRTRDGMSEEQAYLYLRYASRSSRRRLPDLAAEIIKQPVTQPAAIRHTVVQPLRRGVAS